MICFTFDAYFANVNQNLTLQYFTYLLVSLLHEITTQSSRNLGAGTVFLLLFIVVHEKEFVHLFCRHLDVAGIAT